MMPPSVKQDYCAFISYSHDDEPWARQLYRDLIDEKNIPSETLFKDDVSLRKGDEWRPELINSIRSSRNLIVLWSSNALKRQWVNNELAHFDAKLNESGQSEAEARQRMIFVLLDADNEPYKHIQMIPDLKDAGVYDPANTRSAIETLLQNNRALWDDVVEQVYQAIITDDVTIPVSLLIFATTRDRLENLDFTEPPEFADFATSLETLLGDTQIGTRDELIARYGVRRSDWRPIPAGISTISEVLTDLRDRINGISQAPRIRWKPVDAFWNDLATAKQIATAMANELSLIVIDPISLYDPIVHKRLAVLEKSGCFDRENVAVLVLSPFAMSEPNRTFRNLMLNAALSIFDDYYKPGVRTIPYARCSINFGDELAMTRPMLAAIKHHFYQGSNPRTPIQISVGGQGL